MVTSRWLVVFGAMCSAGSLWSAVLIAALLAGVRLVPTAFAVGVAALLTIPGCIAGVIANRTWYATTRPRRPWSLVSWVPPHVPHWASMLAGVVFAGFWLAVVVAFAGLDGNTQQREGRYVVDDSGRITAASPADYDRQVDHEQQISLGVLGAVGVGGVFLTAALMTHEHTRPVTRVQVREAPAAGPANR